MLSSDNLPNQRAILDVQKTQDTLGHRSRAQYPGHFERYTLEDVDIWVSIPYHRRSPRAAP